MMNDTISRQAAIEAVLDRMDVEKHGRNAKPEEIRWTLEALPPVQPEIIHCKDCKYWIPYDWMFSEVWQSQNMADYPEDEMGCNYCDIAMKANDFCSRADRRGEAE